MFYNRNNTFLYSQETVEPMDAPTKHSSKYQGSYSQSIFKINPIFFRIFLNFSNKVMTNLNKVLLDFSLVCCSRINV